MRIAKDSILEAAWIITWGFLAGTGNKDFFYWIGLLTSPFIGLWLIRRLMESKKRSVPPLKSANST